MPSMFFTVIRSQSHTTLIKACPAASITEASELDGGGGRSIDADRFGLGRVFEVGIVFETINGVAIDSQRKHIGNLGNGGFI